MHELAFFAMGCHMLALLDTPDPRGAEQLGQVPAWFEEWEQVLSRFRSDSELSRLNAATQPTIASPVLCQVLELALDAARRSGGLVQPAILPALERAGYDRTFEALPRAGAANAPALPAADWRAIRYNARTRRVGLPAGVRLDLGGIAKGWAAEQAARRLAAYGPALVDAGGDIAVSGPMAGGARWPIAIVNPFAPEEDLAVLALGRGAVATSGRDYRRWLRDGQAQHHIIDPRTGRPADTDVLAATAVAPAASSAEMAAKVALIRGSRAGLAWIEAHPPLAALLVCEDGRVIASGRMERWLDGQVPSDAKSLTAPHSIEARL